MNILVTGGSASGKSGFAESLAVSLSEKSAPMIYIATLDKNSGGDTASRIERHRKMREGKGFYTIECTDSLESLVLENNPVALLEDLGNTVADYIFGKKHSGVSEPDRTAAYFEEMILSALRNISFQCSSLITVTNDISCGTDDFKSDYWMRLYHDVLSSVNALWADECGQVFSVTAGIPVPLK